MSLLKALGGDLVKEGIGLVKRFFPEKMSEAEEKQFEASLTSIVNEFTLKSQSLFDERVKSHEGTAKDLIQAGFMGRILLFFRGSQRIVWGYGTLYLDVMWFSDAWSFEDEQKMATLWLVNLLVLGFLFGERALKNLEPLIMRIIDRVMK